MKRVASVDAMRACAAASVAIFHIHGTVASLQSSPPAWLTTLGLFTHCLGTWGVGIFFILSGFCIHMPTAVTSREPEMRTYARRRFLRIYPPHLVCLLVSLALCFVVEPAFDRWSVTNALTIPKPSWFVLHLAMLHTFSLGAYHSINYVLWSIAVEAHFYLLYPLILVARQRWSLGAITLVLFALASLTPLADRALGAPTLLASNFPGRLWEWVLGAYLAERFVADKPAIAPGWVAGIALVASLLVSGYGPNLPHGVIWSRLLLGWLLAIVVDSGARRAVDVGRGLLWLGVRSYSLYLSHPVAIVLAVLALHPLGWTAPAIAYAACVGLAVALTALTYRAVELPCVAWARGTTTRRAEAELSPGVAS